MTWDEYLNGMNLLVISFGKTGIFEDPEKLRPLYEEFFACRNVKFFLPACKKIVENEERFPVPTVILRYYNEEIKTVDKIVEKTDCEKCAGLGLIIYFKSFDNRPYEYAARCRCQNGTRWSKKLAFINNDSEEVQLEMTE